MIKTLTAALVALSIAAPAAHADDWRYHNHGGNGGYDGYHQRYQGGNGGNGGALIGGLIGGMILGGIINQQYQQVPRYAPQYIPDDDYVPVCRSYVVGRDYYGRPIVRQICQ